MVTADSINTSVGEERKEKVKPVSCARSTHCDCKYVHEIIEDLWVLRGSLLLMLVFFPVACYQMLHAIYERMFGIGTIHENASAFVQFASDENKIDDEDSVMEEFMVSSGIELAKRIKNPNDSLTSVILTKACIRQIKRLNPYLNAVVSSRFQAALQEAKAADEAVANGKVPSDNNIFWGVPLIVKECFEVEDMPYSAGVYSRKNIIGSTTAPAVKEAQNAGGILLGVTNVSEACMWHESINHVYGRTYNPYDFGRTCGGSSGGCGAGVASCMAPIAITSDVGGSTRIPAHYNGVFGHKATGGTVSNANCFPPCGDGKVNNYCQLGPMSKHAEDLWPLLLILARSQCTCGSEQETDCTCATKTLQTYKPTIIQELSIPSIKVYYSTKTLAHPWLVSRIHPEIPERILHSVKHLQSLGCEVEPFPEDTLVPEIFQALNVFMIWSLLMHEGKAETFKEVIRDQTTPFYGPAHVLLETLLSIFNLSKHTSAAMLLALTEYSMAFTPETHNIALREKAQHIRATLEAFLTGKIVWLMPSLPTPAPHHNESVLRIFDVSNTGFFNVMELPATAVPLGLTTDHGLPIGLQVISGRGQDHYCIAIAKALQDGGIAKWLPPPRK